MKGIRLEELLGPLPTSSHRFPLSEETPELGYVDAPDPLFVSPYLTAVASPSTAAGGLVLVEARAAAPAQNAALPHAEKRR